MASITQLQFAFVTGLNLGATDVIWDSLEYRGIPEWDSVAHMVLVTELEDTFDVMLDVDEVIALSSYQAAIAILAKHGVTLEQS